MTIKEQCARCMDCYRDLPEDQRAQVEKVFYAGALAATGTILDLAQREEQLAVVKLQNMMRELIGFAESVQLRVKGRN